MTTPDDDMITVPELRKLLGLPRDRPDGTRDIIAVPRPLGTPIPAYDTWRLALGDWPETWVANPGTGPRFLVMLRGSASPYFIATIEGIRDHAWGSDSGADPASRIVPVQGTAYTATAMTAGRQLYIDVTFGWDRAEEQFAFL